MSEAGKYCEKCQADLKFLKRESIQLGKFSLIFGDWPNLLAGAQDLEFWFCPKCRKLEFYIPEGDLEDDIGEDAMLQVECPVCGAEHDLDDPKCPCCGAKNPYI